MLNLGFSDIAKKEDISLYSDGIEALAFAAKSFELRLEVSQLRHIVGQDTAPLESWVLCRCALQVGLKAKSLKCPIEKISVLPLPALVKINESGWHILASFSRDSVSIIHGLTHQNMEFTLDVFASMFQDEVLLLAKKNGSEKKHRFGFKWFIPSVIRHRRQLRSVIIISIVLQMIALVTPIFFEKITDKVLVSRGLSSLDILSIGMLALACFEPLWGTLRSCLFSNAVGKVNAELSARLFRHMMALPVSFFQTRQTGNIIGRIREMQHIRQFLTGSALTVVLDLVFVIVFLGVMCLYSFSLTGIVFGSLILYFLFWLVTGPFLRDQILTQYQHANENTAFLTEAVNGLETIKTTATENRFARFWEGRLTGYLRQSLRVREIAIAAGQGITLIHKLTAVLLIWWGVKLVIDGNMTAGELVAFNMFSSHVSQPVLRLAQVWQDFQHTLISIRRLGEILDFPTENCAIGLASMPESEGRIDFQNISFRYSDESSEVFRNLTFHINPGEFIGITGPSGSGKSTITRLLQRLYIPQHGRIRVDGTDLAIADPISLRRNISVVQQGSLLFSGTIAENIRQRCPHASDDEVRHVARLAGAHDFIESMPDKYQTHVGENGSFLSGGQRQRIALARALITNPSILILDEATSALDYESESVIINNMPEICKGRTVVSIAHRLGTIKNADRILVLEHGQVAEEGDHKSLVKKDGLYNHLWMLQTGMS